MDPAIASNVPGWLEKYGPMGCALIVVSIALIGLVWRVIPAIVDSAINGFNKRMDAHEETATERHGEIMGKLKSIVPEAPPMLRIRDKKGKP